jgi:uncharacterized membrane protein
MLLFLGLGSALFVAMVLVRFAYVQDLRFRFSGLLFNLSLAWLPMLFSTLAHRSALRSSNLGFWCAGAAWLLFFPNTFYLTTDLIHEHKFGTDNVFRWYDLLMTVGFASAGMFLGSLSLYLMHAIVRLHLGRRAGWLFAVATLALGAFGIYLGRFLRFNSWDAMLSPLRLMEGISALTTPAERGEVAAFCAAFFAFSLAVYFFIVSAISLHQPTRKA